MDVFRSKGIKGVVYSFLVGAIGVVFVLQFNPAKTDGGAKARAHCAAEVKGRCASIRDFGTAYGLAVGRSDDDDSKRHRMRKVIVDGLVERELLLLDAERLGIRLSDDEVSRSLREGSALISLGVETPDATYVAFQLNPDRPMRTLPTKKDGRFDEKEYNKALRIVARTQQEWREMQTAELTAAEVRDLVRLRVRVGDAALFDAFQQEKETVSFKYTTIDRAAFASSVEITDAAIDKHLDDPKVKAELDKDWEKAKFTECRRARHILVKADHSAKPEERDAARKKIEAARERIEKGAKFSEVAREVSEDPGSASRGGELGCFAKGMMVKPFEDAAFSMKPGELSAVIETEYGFHVLKLDAIAKDADAEREWRRERARNTLLSIELESRASAAAKDLLADVAAGKTLEEATSALSEKLKPKGATKKGEDPKKKGDADARAKGATDEAAEPALVVKTATGVTRTGSAFPGARGEANAALFALDKPGAVPPNVLATDAGYAVVQLVEKKPATREDFAKERDKMSRILLAKKRHDAVTEYVLRLRDAAKNEIKLLPDVLRDDKSTTPDE